MTGKDIFKGTLIVLLTLLGAYVLLISLHILVVLIVAIIIASAVRPGVLRLMRWHFSEGLSIVLVYLGLLLGIIALIAIVIPPIVTSLTTNLTSEDRLANRIILVENWVGNTVHNLTGTVITLPDPDTVRAGVSNAVDTIGPQLPTIVGDASSTA